jgi:oligopeptide/dipeptide ABC transporter ATP-binding protein
MGMAILLITHDLGVVAETTDRAAVMYAGSIVESAVTDTLFADPRHPYTQGLIRSIPDLDTVQDRLEIIPGTVPDLRRLPVGCRFQSRCPLVDDHCREVAPPLVEIQQGHMAACWKTDG